jgi:pimeloyl-ACP methyl ester carboxylesterase
MAAMHAGESAKLLAVVCLVAMMGGKMLDDERPAQPVAVAKQGFFYAGGREITQQGHSTIVDQMFVEYQIPAKVEARYPIVMIHGNYQNGSNFLGTPDDREGWAEYFLRHGFSVYVIDQPARGRSAYNATSDGPEAPDDAEMIERLFTAVERFNLWPQAHLHTQWPGSGMPGDPAFEQFRASQNPSLTDNVTMDTANRAALVALLRRIGPAVLMTHSRSGPFGWEVADDASELVKAIVALEPSGPPFYNTPPLTTKEFEFVRPWGLASDHLTYDPPLEAPGDLSPEREEHPQAPGLERCWFASTPHRLPHLARVPILIVTAEASMHAMYDQCTSQYLTRAGVTNDFVRLGDHGIHGNGHMMMIEKNNLEIARLIADWISQHVSPATPAAGTNRVGIP